MDEQKAIKMLFGGDCITEEVFKQYDFIKENNVNYEQIFKRKRQLIREGYTCRMKRINFTDLARSSVYFLVAVRRKQ